MKKIFSILMIFMMPLCLYAVDKNTAEIFTETQETRYKSLINMLRCVVCQNQSLADSDAELAQDLRDQVRNMILKGQSDAPITEFLVSRYGDFVLYNPPLKKKTFVLWLAPIIFLFFALILLIYFIRRHTKMTVETLVLTEKEQKTIEKLLSD